MSNMTGFVSFKNARTRAQNLLKATYAVSQSQKGYHPTTNDNFNSCRIPVIFGTNITE